MIFILFQYQYSEKADHLPSCPKDWSSVLSLFPFSLFSSNRMEYGEDNPCCYFHPEMVIVGVCAVCLKERLLILASKQGQTAPSSEDKVRTHRGLYRKSLPKVFALSSFLHRLELRYRKSHVSDDDASTSSKEESFISIKFEDNGRASWDRSLSSRPSSEAFELSCSKAQAPSEETNKSVGKSVVEHGKSRPTTLRWRKRVGHLFQLARWKQRTTKGGAAGMSHHMGTKVEAVKGRKGWIRALTKRRTME
ncbi:uncharacterized protein [Aristolochia californica]|uniref:uncharacterized protein n=1 Tax=Aristolochia californica TaxID=171875 RepID=UPI0035E04727